MTRSVQNDHNDAGRQAGPISTLTQSKSISTIRSISLFCSFLVALSAGSNYGFSSYSPQLQERLHLTSTQINIVGVMGNMGVYLSGPFWGRLVDRKGPKIALALGAFLVLIGYGGLSVSYQGTFWSSTSLSALGMFSLFSGLGNSGAFTAAMNAQAKSWREERRGLCTALVLSGFGLSAFFYSTLSHTLFPGKTGDYLLLLAFGSSFSFLIGLAFIKILPPDLDYSLLPSSDAGQAGTRRRTPSQVVTDAERSEDGGLYVRPSSTYSRRRTSSDIGGRAYAFAQDTVSDEEASEDSAYTYGDRADSVTRRGVRAEEQQGLLQGGREANGSRSAGEASGSRKAEPTAGLVDKTGRKLLKDPDFLILFSIMTIISGTGLLVINNIGTMTRTLYEYNKREKGSLLEVVLAMDLSAMREGDVQQLQAHQVSAISIGNALGRILMGLMSDLVVNQTGDARYRVFLLLLVCTLALLSQGAAAWPNIISDLKKLFGMSIVTGLMYGTLFGLCPVLTFEWFGLRHFSQNWGIISLSPVLAGNIFNLLFGKIYDSHVPKDGPSHFCPDGEECFRSVFRFTAIGAVIATILSAIIIGRKAGWRKPSTVRNEHGQGV